MVNDRHSLCAAVMNHQYAGESVIELYVVKNSGKVTIDPEHDNSDS
jgi:hypothetical protein